LNDKNVVQNKMMYFSISTFYLLDWSVVVETLERKHEYRDRNVSGRAKVKNVEIKTSISPIPRETQCRI
jgi:hypothetical protein